MLIQLTLILIMIVLCCIIKDFLLLERFLEYDVMKGLGGSVGAGGMGLGAFRCVDPPPKPIIVPDDTCEPNPNGTGVLGTDTGEGDGDEEDEEDGDKGTGGGGGDKGTGGGGGDKGTGGGGGDKGTGGDKASPPPNVVASGQLMSGMVVSLRTNDGTLTIRLTKAMDTANPDKIIRYAHSIVAVEVMMNGQWLSWHRQPGIKFKIELLPESQKYKVASIQQGSSGDPKLFRILDKHGSAGIAGQPITIGNNYIKFRPAKLNNQAGKEFDQDIEYTAKGGFKAHVTAGWEHYAFSIR